MPPSTAGRGRNRKRSPPAPTGSSTGRTCRRYVRCPTDASPLIVSRAADRLQIAFSGDGGRQFDDPVIVDDNRPAGRVDVVLLDDGSAIVSWLGEDAHGNAIRLRHVQDDGTVGVSVLLSAAFRGRGTGVPQMVRSGDQLYVAWVDTRSDTPRVRLVRTSVQAVR